MSIQSAVEIIFATIGAMIFTSWLIIASHNEDYMIAVIAAVFDATIIATAIIDVKGDVKRDGERVSLSVCEHVCRDHDTDRADTGAAGTR